MMTFTGNTPFLFATPALVLALTSLALAAGCVAAAILSDVLATMRERSSASRQTQPAESQLIQIGFKHPVDWPFASANPHAAHQIFLLLPRAIAYALGANQGEVVVAELQALNTASTPGYVTTLALTYVPCTAVQVLQQQILDANSPLYRNADRNVTALVSSINPDIGIAR